MIERLSNLDNSNYLKQRSIMMVSLGKYENIINELKGTRNYLNTICEDVDILTEAKYIGDYLINNAIYSDSNQYITWEDISISSNGTWQASAMTECLYNRIAGIAYFLYEIFYISKDKKYYNAYKKAMNTAIKDSKFTNAISAYNGQVSLMFPILNELKKSNKSDFIYFIDDTIKYIENNLNLITEYDWLSGCSGIIALILNAYECINNPEYIKLANILGKKIITELEFEKIKLVGLGHGCTGISMALIRLYKYIKNKDYLSFALKLLDHERDLINSHNYCEEAKWCKGSTGMGIGRLDILNYYQDQTLLDEINLCIKNISSSMKKGDCLCHGNMGDIELLNSYFEKNEDENIKSMINTKLIDLISMKNKLGKFSIRNIPEFMSFDLFTGISGIGYELLRLYNPESISNVLTLSLNRLSK